MEKTMELRLDNELELEEAAKLLPSDGIGIVTICYNTADIWPSRQVAKDFYTEASYYSEGAERERYINVLFDIAMGKDICYDGVSPFIRRVARRRAGDWL